MKSQKNTKSKDANNKAFAMGFADGIKPPPDLDLSQWADEYRHISSKTSAISGRWGNEITPYLVEIMDCLTDDNIQQVTMCSASQVGKTEIALNLIGYHVHQEPCAMMLIQPTEYDAKEFSTTRITPMFQDTPVLQGALTDALKKDGSNNELRKSFDGGVLFMAGGNSPSRLASKSVRVVIIDEVDKMSAYIGKDGDPIQQVIQRTQNYWNKKILMISTPTIKGVSVIKKEFDKGDQRYCYIPCPDCGEEQRLVFSSPYTSDRKYGVIWSKKDGSDATYSCKFCGSCWDDGARYRAIKKCKWIASQPLVKHASFQISVLYSTFVKLSDVVADFLASKSHQGKLQAFVNLKLGEEFDLSSGSDKPRVADLLLRRETYDSTKLPLGVYLITAGVDIQKDRIEMSVYGWGLEGECWLVEHRIFRGDITSIAPWRLLEEYISIRYSIGDFSLPIEAIAIDSGYQADDVMRFVARNFGSNVIAIKGVASQSMIFKHATKSKLGQLFTVGVSAAKIQIYGNLKVSSFGSNYIHFPSTADEAFFNQLTAEDMVYEYNKNGYEQVKWIIPQGRRNEALDCFVYATVAKEYINIDIGHRCNLGLASLSKKRGGRYKELGGRNNG